METGPMIWNGSERRDGSDRRSSLTISGPWKWRMVFVGTSGAALWLSVGIIIGLLAALGAFMGISS